MLLQRLIYWVAARSYIFVALAILDRSGRLLARPCAWRSGLHFACR